MGSCSSQPSRPADAGLGAHPQHAPMWVVGVGHVLDMTGALQPHEVLKALNLLETWRPEMFTLFVSHQWLGLKHPDPKGEQLAVLQLVFKNLIARRLIIENDATSQFFGGNLSAKQLGEVGKWYIWLDYFCVPQPQSLQVGRALDGPAEDHLLYVKSIPSYVDLCSAFVALAPRAVHQHTSEVCDTHSWLQRGWCRTELWCYFLSTRSKLPIIEVKSPDAVRFIVPEWHRCPVHSGNFALETDRASCSAVIEAALTKYVAELRQSNKIAYRLYLSLFEEITGLARKLRTLDEFLSDFDFSKPLQQYKGLGPVACAALAGDEDLVHSVVIAKADLHSRAPGMPETTELSDLTPLHLALWFRSHSTRVVETLLELGADANSSTINIPPPLGVCRTAAAVDLLIRSRAEVNCQGKFLFQLCPIQAAASRGAPPEVIARLLELRANVHGGKGGMAKSSPLHHVAASGDSNNDLRNAQLLVENGADVNQVVKCEGFIRMLELMSRAYSSCRSPTGILARFFTHSSATPLGWCALLENCGLLVFLLRARADPEIRDNTGLRPIDMARSETIRDILRNPDPHVYLLEHASDWVTEAL